jgi:hypothetical protein
MKPSHLLLSGLLTFGPIVSGFAETPEPVIVPATEARSQVRLTGLGHQKKFRHPDVKLPAITFENYSPPKAEAGFSALPDTILNTLPPAPESPDRSGRTELITASLVYSLIYYGWAIPTALDAKSGRGYAASYMLVGGSGFFVPFLLTRDKPITNGMARAFTLGAGLGIAHGWGLTIGVMGEDIEPEVGLGVSVATSLAEGIIGLSYARKHNLSQGHVSSIGTGGLFGAALTVPIPYFFDSENAQAYALTGLVGSGIGIWAGDRLAKKIPVADGDPQIAGTAGLIGGLLSVALANSVSDDFTKGTLATLIGGTATGLGLGIVKIKGLDYSKSNANLITLGSFAGGLIGLGIVYVADDNASGEAYLWGSGLGALGGFLATDRLTRGRKTPKLGNLKIGFNPMALRNVLYPEPTDFTHLPKQFGQAHLINASLRF